MESCAKARTPTAPVGGIPAAPAAAARPKNAFKLTDPQRRRAYVWWEVDGPVVETDAPAYRRRVRRALKKPIWSIEDEPDEFGVLWSTRALLRPDDPRYPSRWFWSLGQVGLDDVVIQVVRRESRQPVGRAWRCSDETG